MKTTVTVNSADTDRLLSGLKASLTGQGKAALMSIVGKGLEQDLQRHFRRRNQEPNKRGWPKQHFWGRIRSATSFTGATEDTATVTIADEAMRAKVAGATIRPGPGKKALAIPLRKEAYGVRPSSGTIAGLFVARSKRTGKAFLARTEGDALRIYYLLTPRVRVPADPRALPEDDQLAQPARQRVASYINRAMEVSDE